MRYSWPGRVRRRYAPRCGTATSWPRRCGASGSAPCTPARHLRGGDLLARTGGDEFCALLDDSDTDDAAQVGERIVHAVRELNLGVTLSVGIAAGPGTAVRATVDRADRAMYTAKSAGG